MKLGHNAIMSWPGPGSDTFVEIADEIISTVILLTLNHSRRAVVSYKPKYVHKIMVYIYCLFKLA